METAFFQTVNITSARLYWCLLLGMCCCYLQVLPELKQQVFFFMSVDAECQDCCIVLFGRKSRKW